MTLAPAALLVVALRENDRAATQFADVNRSGSLRYRSLRLCAPALPGDASEQLAQMRRIRDDLRRRYPAAVAATDPAWAAFAGELGRTGGVRWQTADAMRLAADGQTRAIEEVARRQGARVSGLLDAGLLGIAASLLGMMLLMRGLWLSELRQARLTAILDRTTDLIGIADPSGRLVYLNRAFRLFLGIRTQAALPALSIPAIHAPWSRAQMREQGHPAALRHGLWQGESAFRDTAGREVPVSQVVLTHTAADGSLRHLSTIARDMTEQKQTEQALRAERERFAAVVAMQQELACADLAPEALRSLIARRAMELIGADGAAVAVPDGDALVYCSPCGLAAPHADLRVPLSTPLVEACLRTGEVQHCADAWRDPRVSRPACDRIGLRSLLSVPLRDGAEILGILVILSARPEAFRPEDIQSLRLVAGLVAATLSRAQALADRTRALADRTRALAEREESQALFLTSLNAMQEGVTIQDDDGTILMCNESAQRILRLAEREFVGRHVLAPGWRVLAPDGTPLPRELQPGPQAMSTGQAQEAVMGLARPGEPDQWLHMKVALLFHAGETRPYAVVQTFADITADKEAEETLRRREEQLRAVVEQAMDGVFFFDPETGVLLETNQALREMLGYTEAEAAGLTVYDLIAHDRASIEQNIALSAREGQAALQERDYRHKDGSLRHTEVRVKIIRYGGREAFCAVVHDLTERKRMEEELRRNEDRLHRLHDLTTQRGLTLEQRINALLALGCAFFDLTIGVVTCITGDRYEITHSASPENSVPAGLVCDLGDTYCSEVMRAEKPLAFAHVGASNWRLLPAYAVFGLEAYLGAPLWVNEELHGTLCFSSLSPHAAPFTEADLEILRLMSQWVGGELAREESRRQIESYNVVLEFQKAELEKANEELEARATLDGLTAIKNHRAFQERLEEEAVRATRYGTPLALVMLDVDSFKQYNDAFGHPEGDLVLKKVARVLSQSARETDLVARYGGEEFAVLLPQTDAAGAGVIAERIRRALETAEWPRRAVTASLGVASLHPGMTGGDLVACADEALYRSKTAGRNRVTQASAGEANLAGRHAPRPAGVPS